MRWGILGAAGIARKEIIPAMRLVQGADLVAVASRDRAKGQTFAADHAIPQVYASYEALLAAPDIDAVYIPTPNHLHVPLTLAALKAGKHVLCEKPFGLTADDVAQVAPAARAARRLAMEGFMVAHHPQWDQARTWLSEIGALRHIEGAFAYFNADPANVRNMADIGGGGLYDIGVYPVVTARLVTGREPTRAACVANFDPAFKTDRLAAGLLDFGDFAMSFYVGTQAMKHQSMRFHGERGIVEVADIPFNARNETGENIVRLRREDGSVEEARFKGLNQYAEMIAQFQRAAAGKEPPKFTLESSVNNQRVIDALLKGARSGQWERV